MKSERLFEPFFDPVDRTVACPADITEVALAERIDTDVCCFPLFADSAAPLCEQIASWEYAPRSARYGSYNDNILGMNWELPDGRRVRVGERVVKNSTGYDLKRFLLHASASLGRAVDYVLRLRARQEVFQVRNLYGSREQLDGVRRELLHSPWRHVIDAMDWVFDGSEPEGFLQLQYDCRRENTADFDRYWEELTERHGCAVRVGEPLHPSVRRTVAAVKLTPGEAVRTARGLHCESGFSVFCQVVTGYVIVQSTGARNRLEEGEMEALREKAEALGGHVRIPGESVLQPEEAAWVARLLADWAEPMKEGVEA